jgi:molybdopterin converting factor small subunit
MPIRLTLNLGPVVRERAGLRQRRARLETEAATTGELLRRLGVADLSDNLMVVVNHRMVTDELTPLAEGDEVGLYLPLEGG